MPKRKRKHNRARNLTKPKPNLADAFIDQANTRYNHPAASTAGMIACIAVICFAVGVATALVLGWLVDDKAKITWQIAIYVAIGTATLQVVLATTNSIIVVPLVTRMTRRMMQRRTGRVIEDTEFEKAIDENEQPSKVGPAAISAIALYFICLQYDAPDNVLLLAPACSAAASSIVAHLTDHRTIRMLWKGVQGQHFKATMRRSKRRRQEY